MKVKITDSLCIMCGACVSIAPEEIAFTDAGFAGAVNEEIKQMNIEAVMEALDTCPTGAIEIE